MAVDPKNNRRSVADAAAALALLAVLAFYLLRGMPWPHVDDLAFTGAGMDLARTGQLTNHALDGWLATFHTDRFYIQPPLPAYFLAGWVRLFGHGTASFMVFEWVWYAVGGFWLVRVLGRFEVALAARLSLCGVYLTVLIQSGFRPEAEAFGLTFAGLGLLDTAATFARRFGAVSLLGLGALCYPMTPALAGPLAVALVLARRPAGVAAGAFLRASARVWAWPVVLGAAAVAASFLAMIHGELGAFWSVFNAHRQMRTLPGGPFLSFLRLLTGYSEASLRLPVFLLLVGVVVFTAARWRHAPPAARLLVSACGAGMLGCILLFAARAPAWIGLLAFCAASTLPAQTSSPRVRWLLAAGLAGLYAWSQALWISRATLQRFPEKVAWQTARQDAGRSGKGLVVDSSMARYAFDYQLPEGTKCLEYLHPWETEQAVLLSDKRDDVSWLISASAFPDAGRERPRIKVGGHTFHSMLLTPDEPLVLP